jgi:ABC transporter DrrB family efflux protein
MTAAISHRPSVKATVRQTSIITRRNILRNIRLPRLLVFATIQPVMFLVLFNYVFGGAVSDAGPAAAAGSYIDWLIPGILVQSAVFGSSQTAVGLTEDLGAGVIDRFRSLPIARSAVLAGRTNADLFRGLWVNLLMLAVGYAMGWRFGQGFPKMMLGLAIVLAFAYTMSWGMACLGLAIKDSEAVQVASFLPLFPLVFASSVFVPTSTMPSWLQVFADNQPITILANTARSLMLPEQAVTQIGLSQGSLIVQSLAWTAGLMLLFAPLAVRLYRRVSD